MPDTDTRNRPVKLVFTALSLALIFGFRHIPAPAGLNPLGMQVLGIFLGMLVLWLTVSVTWASILCLLAMALLPDIALERVLSLAFGNWLFIFLICTFAITHTLAQTQFIRRCVFYMVSNTFARKNPWNFIIFFFASICVIGLFTEPTVLFVMFLPIAEDIFSELKLKPGDKTARMIALGVVICCSISGATTPISHTFPLIALAFYQRDTGIAIDYMSYSVFGIAAGVILLLFMILAFRFILKPDLSAVQNLNITKLKGNLQPMERKEKITLGVFGLVVLFWLLPSIAKSFFPEFSAALSAYGNALPPMAGLVLLSILTDKGKPVLDFADCMKNGVAWTGIFMACSILALGNIMTMDEVGLVDYLTAALSPLTHELGSWAFILAVILWAVVQTNFSSNMVTFTVVYTVAMPLAAASGHINLAALACVIGAASSLAFATPAATAHVSIASGIPWLSVSELFKYGVIMMIMAIVVLLSAGYPLLNILIPADAMP
jgi:sodium-dependent dicarboxylate transporter 2/3/5